MHKSTSKKKRGEGVFFFLHTLFICNYAPMLQRHEFYYTYHMYPIQKGKWVKERRRGGVGRGGHTYIHTEYVHMYVHMYVALGK